VVDRSPRTDPLSADGVEDPVDVGRVGVLPAVLVHHRDRLAGRCRSAEVALDEVHQAGRSSRQVAGGHQRRIGEVTDRRHCRSGIEVVGAERSVEHGPSTPVGPTQPAPWAAGTEECSESASSLRLGLAESESGCSHHRSSRHRDPPERPVVTRQVDQHTRCVGTEHHRRTEGAGE